MSIKNSSKYLFYLSDIAMDWSDHAMWWPEKNIWLDNTRWTLDQYNITGYLLSEYKYSKKNLIKILPGSKDRLILKSIFNLVISSKKLTTKLLYLQFLIWVFF